MKSLSAPHVRKLLSAVMLTVCSISSGAVVAQEYCDANDKFCGRIKYDYYRNKMWPTPFRAADTRSVMSFFNTQANIGWRLHNTVGEAMYQVQTGQLTDSGKAHVKWIVTRAPQERRIVFVKKGVNQKQTAARVEATQVAISEYVPTGQLPQIYLTDRESPGSSGAYHAAINRAMNASVPNPRLEVSDAASAGGTP